MANPSDSGDAHLRLKRWERKRLSPAEASLTGPAAWCRYCRPGVAEQAIPAYLVRLFQGDITCVQAVYPEDAEGNGGCWLVRGGMDWPHFLKRVASRYRMGSPVPEQFRPLRKVPPQVVDNLDALPEQELPQVFTELRVRGFLPELPKLNRQTCPSRLPWSRLKGLFQDFR